MNPPSHANCPMCQGTEWADVTTYPDAVIPSLLKSLALYGAGSFLVALLIVKDTDLEWPLWGALIITVLLSAVTQRKRCYRQCRRCRYRYAVSG